MQSSAQCQGWGWQLMYYLARRAHYIDVSVGMWVRIGNTHAQCQGWGWQLREEEASDVTIYEASDHVMEGLRRNIVEWNNTITNFLMQMVLCIGHSMQPFIIIIFVPTSATNYPNYPLDLVDSAHFPILNHRLCWSIMQLVFLHFLVSFSPF